MHSDPPDDHDHSPDKAADDGADPLVYDYPLNEEEADFGDWRRDEGAAEDYDWLEAPADADEPTRAQQLGWDLRWLAYGLAFALPLLVLLGLGLALSGRDGDDDTAPTEAEQAAAAPSPTVLGAWPPGVFFAPHTVPAIIRDDLAAPGAQRGYLFHGEAGDIWEIAIEPVEQSGLEPVATLFGPSGEIVARGEDRATGDLSTGIVLRLSQRGDYRLLIEGGSSGAVGTYVLSLSAE